MYSVIERRTSDTILMRHEVCRTATSFSSFPSSWPSLPSSLSSPCYPPSIPKVGSMQVDIDVHRSRVHHICKIYSSSFKEGKRPRPPRSQEHTSELQSPMYLV